MNERGNATPSAELTMAPAAIREAARRALRRPPTRPVGWALVADAVAAHARDSDRPALIDQRNGTTTYSRLNERVGLLRDLLLEQGCGQGDRIAVAGPRDVDSVVAFLALESIGAVYVPVDPQWPAGRLAQVFIQTGCSHVLTHPADGAGGRSLAQAVAVSGVTPLSTAAAEVASGKPRRGWERPQLPANEGQAAYIIHTSGSTGRPKGAITEHRAMINHLRQMIEALGIHRDDVVAFNATPIYVVSVWQMLAGLLAGATVAIVRELDETYPRRLLNALRTAEVTIVQLVPTMIGLIVDELSRRAPADRLGKLRWLISTGEELRPQLARKVLDMLPDTRLMNAYGMSECSDDVAQHVIRPADLRSPRLPIGLPIAGTVLHVLVEDREGWRPTRNGETGELFVGGLAVGAGYVGDMTGRSTAFFHDPIDAYSPTRRLYRTGDMARIEDGLIYCLGRTDRQVKIRGVRVELDEVERVLEQHPDVSQCAVTAEAEGDSFNLKAHVVMARNTTPEQLQEFLLERLPNSMLPKQWEMVAAIPVTSSGKVDYRKLINS
ncbi:amino acid adenylation domain-containing protein [Nonomuraea sp. NPDC046802]|uniref:amino acid adenylation domain-containing protein n=1 Tax=Nonomuraea sp. NPDC046802 TaxID=3154919 RepID=UPI0033D8D5E9